MTDTQELVREAEWHLVNRDILEPEKDLIQRLLDVVKERGWQLIGIKDCGCEIRRSNKGNAFCDSCAECTNLPKPEAGGE